MRILYSLVILLVACPVLYGQDSARLYLETGNRLKGEGNCQEALPLYQRAVQLDPRLAEGFVELAWCHNELGQYAQALQHLRTAEGLLPDNKRVLYETGFAYYHLDSADKAIRLFRQALTQDSNYLLARIGMADVYRDKKNDSRTAINWYRSVIARDPNNKKAHYWAGWCHNELKEYTQAQPYLQRVLSLDPEDRLAYSELGYAAYSLKNFTDAISYLKKTETLPGPRIETAMYYLGLCYTQTGQKQEAIKKYNELVLMESELATGLLAEIRAMKQ